MLKFISITLLPPPPSTPWITLAEAQQRANASLNLLNAEYNKHGIYLVGNNGVCGQAIATVSVYDFGSQSPSASDLRDNNGIQHTDGLDIYIFSIAGEASGYAYHIPNNYLFVGGTRSSNNLPAEQTEVVIHEVGHCFGLSHTQTGNSDGGCDQTSNGCDCNCFGVPAGFCCGDYVDDTEINNIDGSISTTTGCNPIPSGVTTNSTLNFMSYVYPDDCRSQFTPGQVSRMRRYLFNAPVLQAAQAKTVINNPPSNVTIWNTPPSIFSNILIPTGQTLIVNGTLEMPPRAYIYVEKGAQLQVNGTITGACGKMWQGVIVNGSKLSAQTTALQGYLKINPGGIIEHAVCGIQVQGHLNGILSLQTTGGMVFSNGGFIKNCTQAVKYAPYDKQANTGRFFNTTFSMNNDYRGGNEKIEMVNLKGVYGLIFNGSDFIDDRTFCTTRDDRANGIVAEDAGLIAMQGFFDGLDYGIHFSTLFLGAGIFSVSSNEFKDCFTGVYSTETPGFRVVGNTFTMNRLDDCDNNLKAGIVGVQAFGLSANAMVSDNDFVSTSNDFDLEELLGTSMIDLGYMNNEVFSNTFNLMTVGNQAGGVNGGQMGEMQFSGLLYECNSNENALDGDFLVEDGQVRLVQGEEVPGPNQTVKSTAAGNTFGGTEFGFRNDGVELTYYYGNGPNEDPGNQLYSSGINKIDADNNNLTCGGGTNSCPNPPCPEFALSATKTSFFQNKQTWLSKIAAFPNILSPVQKVQEQSAISQLRLELDRAGRTILHSYQLDTVSIKTDSILTWLEYLETYEADYHRARHHFFIGNFIAADNIFSTLPSKYGLTGERLATHNQVLEVFDILYPHLSAGGIVGDLPQTILQDLKPYAVECNEAGFLAGTVLERNGVDLFPDCQAPENRSRKFSNPEVFNTEVSVFPNPTSYDINVVSKSSKLSSVQLFDVNGTSVFFEGTVDGSQSLSLNTEKVASGFYLLRLRLRDGSVIQTKIIIQH
ncbi:MAG: zinc-dependent metalloprotease [Saprospiraceae bacterium]|nr:zinc-dependent metalloprotease [Saprospiraceae bacterium]